MFEEDKEIIALTTKYCPICARDIVPQNIAEVAAGEHDGFLYVHDNIGHSDSDIEALEQGIH